MANLPLLDQNIAISDSSGKPTFVFHQWWKTFIKTLEAALQDITDALNAAIAAQATADAAQNNAITAINNALAAQTTANSALSTANAAQTTASNAVIQDGTPTWDNPSGTLTRSTFVAYAGQTVSATPTQAEVQAIDDHLKLLSRHVAALITDLTSVSALSS